MGTSTFTRTAAGAVAGLLIVGSLAAAGCGGGGSSSTTTAASTSSTSTTTTAGINPHSVPKSTPIASSDYFNVLVQGFEKGGLSSSQAESAAHCIQDGLTKAGFKTQGDAEGKQNTKKALQVIFPCVQKAKTQ